MMQYLKENLCFILFGILFLCVCGIITNAIIDGVQRNITQKMIDDTYRIHK
ncbi:hypothetical protein FDG95_gp558 [Pectobacterium phage vB_PcaM_CBB]|uniref:Uncharacterized protein n=1 Tax=Pectobacterium phage vB_PcaM_CBB TaxID=2772511 RepID=A0A1L2CVE4_9CAUD|nr:hypothetical protein FDG95_gp558 [Pectobacterium phage vB_PcaM_CBB]AMM43984.1 hypothetical protein CBB_421 [Pectobacterium phage vB_PcaM_CBB]